MLVILTEEQILPTTTVCQGCLWADHQGLPRQRQGSLCCGHSLNQNQKPQAKLYQCQMGFKLAEIE